MASRLSEESLKEAYDRGHQSFALRTSSIFSVPIFSSERVDLDQLLVAKNPRKAIQALAPQDLYLALNMRGLEDSLDVLPLISRQQFIRIFDYDVWHEDRLAPGAAFKWLELYRQLSPKQQYKRFRQLDEEYQLALLGSFIEMFDEEQFENLAPSQQDGLYRLPCGTLWYRIKTADRRLAGQIEELIESCIEGDIGYAYSLLAHAAHLPPNEQEALIAQFRKARLEEDGFVPYEDSQTAFHPLDLTSLTGKWWYTRGAAGEETRGLISRSEGSNQPFFRKVLDSVAAQASPGELDDLSRSLTFLGNVVATAARVEPDDHQALRRIVQQTYALIGLGVEYLARGRERTGVDIVRSEHPQILFRTGISLIRKLQEGMLDMMEVALVPHTSRLRDLWRCERRGVLLRLMDKAIMPVLGFEVTEMLKGLFNRFPLYPVETEAQEGGETQRVVFAPVDSLQSLAAFGAQLDALGALLQLVNWSAADGQTELVDLDRHLLTSLARVLTGSGFLYQPFSDEELSSLARAEEADVRRRADEFMTGLEGTLAASLTEQGVGAEVPAETAAKGWWAVSRKVEGLGVDSVKAGLAACQNLMQQLFLALANARKVDSTALRGLVDIV